MVLLCRLGLADKSGSSLESKLIAVWAKAADHTCCSKGNVGMVPKAFTPVHIRDVELDDRPLECLQCIVYGDRRMREGTCINDDGVARMTRLVNPVNELSFVVRLPELNSMPSSRVAITTHSLDIGKRRTTVDVSSR